MERCSADQKPDRVYSPAEKPTEHPNEITDRSSWARSKRKLMAMWLSKFLKRPTNSGKMKVTEKRASRGGGYGLELLTLRAVVSPPDATLRKGYCLFCSVASGGETTAGRAEANLRVHWARFYATH